MAFTSLKKGQHSRGFELAALPSSAIDWAASPLVSGHSCSALMANLTGRSCPAIGCLDIPTGGHLLLDVFIPHPVQTPLHSVYGWRAHGLNKNTQQQQPNIPYSSICVSVYMLPYYLIRAEGHVSGGNHLAFCPLHTLRTAQNILNWGNSCGVQGYKKTNEWRVVLTHPSFNTNNAGRCWGGRNVPLWQHADDQVIHCCNRSLTNFIVLPIK